jgi:hypothetical protein
MSDPVTNVEIEDVLSSIRRLVTEDSNTPPATPAEKMRDRLVLTPALRVEDAQPSVQTGPILLSDIAKPAEAAPIDQGEIANLSDLVEQELGKAMDELVQDDTDTAPTFDLDDSDETWAQEDLELAQEDAHDLPTQVEQPGVDDDLAAKIAALEALVGYTAPVEEPEEEIAEQETLEDSLSEAVSLAQAEEALEEVDLSELPSEELEEADEAAPLEDYDETPATFIRSVQPEPEVVEPASPLPVDEAVVREMVANIVRQELQGVLGERITRNVRNLVRREIHRVLSNEDYE